MSLARVNTTIDVDLLERVDAYARRHREDRSTAIRQLLDSALRDLEKREVVEAYVGGRLTLRELAGRLSITILAAHDLLAAEGVAVAQGRIDDTDADLAAVLADVVLE